MNHDDDIIECGHPRPSEPPMRPLRITDRGVIVLALVALLPLLAILDHLDQIGWTAYNR
ncbi:hypothetical protein [Phycicoccus sp.]|uniref:hypothetical protein n=1 Tax=Phycicoccus sp. TaxID=1902410 RepID=UPI002C9592F7|nr:hypothetical protein [Phycicoccus sp.]HMM95418.1 hypothetical protein [Phycicoccus sp.]